MINETFRKRCKRDLYVGQRGGSKSLKQIGLYE